MNAEARNPSVIAGTSLSNLLSRYCHYLFVFLLLLFVPATNLFACIDFSTSNSIVDENAGTMTFEVTWDDANCGPLLPPTSGPGPDTVTVDFSTLQGSATIPQDFGPLPGNSTTNETLQWTYVNAALPVTVDVSIINDSITETIENFSGSLTNALFFGEFSSTPTSLPIGQSTQAVTIIDDDTMVVDFAPGSQNITHPEGTSGATISVETTSGTGTCNVRVQSNDLTANSNSDYTAFSYNLDVTTTAHGFIDPILTDGLFEGTEQFEIVLTPGTLGPNPSCAIGTNNVGTVNIQDIDSPPVIELSVGSPAIVSEGENLIFNVEVVTAFNTGSCSYIFRTIDGSATTPADYAGVTQTRTINTNLMGSENITISTVLDTVNEPAGQLLQAEILPSNLPNSCLISPTSSATTREIRDRRASFSQSAITVTEGTASSVNISQGYNDFGPSSCAVAVTTFDGTATAPGDYTPLNSAVFVIPAAGINSSVSVPIGHLADSSDGEPNEVFTMVLTQTTSAGVPACELQPNTNTTLTVTINDISPPIPSIQITSATLAVNTTEGISAVIETEFEPGSVQTNCDYTIVTVDNTAVAPSDYTAQSEVRTLVPGGNNTAIIPVNTDSQIETSEDFSVVLQPFMGSTDCMIGANNTAIVTITDATTPTVGTVQITPATVSISSTEGTTVNVDVEMVAGTGTSSCDVDISTVDDTATSSTGDYTHTAATLTIGPSSNGSISIQLLGDSTSEITESFTVQLSPTAPVLNPACNIGTSSVSTIDIEGTVPTEPTVPTVEFSSSPLSVSVYEGDIASYTVQRVTGSGNLHCGVNPVQTAGTASSGDHIFETLIISSATATLPIHALSDFVVVPMPEGLETATFTLVGQGSGTIPPCLIGANDTATLAIYDREAQLLSTAQTVVEGSPATVDLGLVPGFSALPICDVQVTSVDGTAVAGMDYAGVSQIITLNTAVPGGNSIPLTILSDSAVEAPETFELQFSGIHGGPTEGCQIVGSNTHTVTISDNSPTFIAEINSTTAVLTGPEGSTAIVEVALAAGSSLGVCDVDIVTTDGTATSATGDYTALAQTIQVQPSSNTLIPVSLLTDSLVEANESLTVSLVPSTSGSNPACAINSGSNATITITDLIPPPTVEFDATSTSLIVSETSGIPSLTLTVTSGAAPASVDVTTVNGSAVSGSDFTGITAQTITIPTGTTGTVSIPIIADAIPLEGDETFTVTLVPTPGSTTLVGANDVATVTITEATVLPKVEFSSASTSFTLDENGVSPTLAVVISSGSGPATVQVNTVNGSAVAPSDYTTVSQTLVFPAGTSSQSITVPINIDNDLEPNETLTVVLTPVPGSTTLVGANDVSTITIVDTTPVPIVEFTAGSVSNSVNEDSGQADVEVVLSAGTGPASVDISSVQGSAVSPTDYTAISTTVSFPAGATAGSVQTISVPLVNDTVVEGAESFSLSLTPSAGTPALAGTNDTATITIVDTTVIPIVEFSSSSLDNTVQENSGTVSVDAVLVAGTGPASVAVQSVSGSATDPDDFTALSATVTFPAGAVAGDIQTITIPVSNDSVIENDETFTLTMVAPSGSSTLVGNNTTATITLVDTTVIPGIVSFAATDSSLIETQGTARIELIRTGNGAVTVTVNSIGESASSGVDYEAINTTVSWDLNEVGSKFVQVTALSDNQIDPDETYLVQLSSNTPGSIGDTSEHRVTIQDFSNPGILQFVDSEITVDESTGTLQIAVERVGGSDGSVFVSYQAQSGSAIANEDFVVNAGTLSWDAGDTTIRNIEILLTEDTAFEPAELLTIVLSGASPVGDSMQLGENSVLPVTIIDNPVQLGKMRFRDIATRLPENEASVSINVERIDSFDGNISVDYATRVGSANEGSDFEPQSGTLSWESGDSSSRTITINLTDDNVVEGIEEFFVDLVKAYPVGNDQQLGDPATHRITLTDHELQNDGGTPFRVTAMNNDVRTGVQGQMISDLMFQVTDIRVNDAAVPQIAIHWRAIPADAVEFLEGNRVGEDMVTLTGEDGVTTNSIRLLDSDGIVRIIGEARLDTIGLLDASIMTREDIPDFDVAAGQGLFTVRIGIGELDSLSTNQDATGDGLDAACTALRALGADMGTQEQGVDAAAQLDLENTCSELEERIQNSENPATDIDRLAPEELFAIADGLIESSDLQLTNVYSRINALRSGSAERLDLSGLQFKFQGETIPGSVVNAAQNSLYTWGGGGGASNDDANLFGLSGRFGFFLSGSISIGEIDGGISNGTGLQQNADIRSESLTLGSDYRVSESAVFGAALSVAKNRTEFSSVRGGSEIDTTGVTLFGTWYAQDKGYLDFVLDVGSSSYAVDRQINFVENDETPVIASGNTDALVSTLTVGAGRNFSKKGWEFGPYGRISITNATIDGYRETTNNTGEGFGSVLDIQSHDVTSMRLSIGGQTSRVINTKKAVIIPQVRFELEKENEQSKDGITASFVADPLSTPFTIEGNERDTGYFNLGAGASFQLPEGRSGQLFYETRLQQDNVTQHWLKFGLRLEF